MTVLFQQNQEFFLPNPQIVGLELVIQSSESSVTALVIQKNIAVNRTVGK